MKSTGKEKTDGEAAAGVSTDNTEGEGRKRAERKLEGLSRIVATKQKR